MKVLIAKYLGLLIQAEADQPYRCCREFKEDFGETL